MSRTALQLVFLAVIAATVTAGCDASASAPHTTQLALDRSEPVATQRVVLDDSVSLPPLEAGTAPISGLRCARCHTAFADYPTVHRPLVEKKQCLSCHVAEADEHPVAGATEFSLAAPDPELCRECHEAIPPPGAARHAALDTGCMSCHRPHVSEHPGLLTAPDTWTLCLQCHPMDLAAATHAPVLQGKCGDCHDPHGSAYPSLLVASPRGSLCAGCHPEHSSLGEREDAHAPVRDSCLACHTGHGTDQPALLDRPAGDLCRACHAELGEERLSPLRHAVATDCLFCHDPHGNRADSLRRVPETELCGSCHQVVGSQETVHGAISQKGCTPCHDPHDSGRSRLLTAERTELCSTCHERTTIPAAGVAPSIHEPVATGNCEGCHAPHGAPRPYLLVGALPQRIKAPYQRASVSLCFRCHDPALVETTETRTTTRFRDGKKNLHHLHVVENGRTCRACHEFHTSGAPRLIATALLYGPAGWTMPIQFEPSADGGACLASCHVERQYRRRSQPESEDP